MDQGDEMKIDPKAQDHREILETRAIALAQSTRQQQELREGFTALVLCLGKERYGVELPYIWEVLPHRQVTPVPGLPPMARGVINFRGEAVPLYDLLAVVSGKAQDHEPAGSCVVFGTDQVDFAVSVDSVEPPVWIESGELKESVSKPGDRGYAYVRGFAKNRVVVLNMAALLKDESLIVNQENET